MGEPSQIKVSYQDAFLLETLALGLMGSPVSYDTRVEEIEEVVQRIAGDLRSILPRDTLKASTVLSDIYNRR